MIVVLGDGVAGDPSPVLARGLRRLGEVVVLAALDPHPSGAGDVAALRCSMSSGDEVAGVLARAEDAAGPLHAVVLASAGAAATALGELAGLDPAEWTERVETPLRRTLACFQGAYRRLRGRGGGLVVLVPTLSLVGAAGLAPWAAVAEAQRALAKSAGRAWGGEGITVNCLALPGAVLRSRPGPEDPVVDQAGERGPDRPGLPPPSLTGPPDFESTVAPVVAALATPGWAGVTGATIAVDGGVWMTP